MSLETVIWFSVLIPATSMVNSVALSKSIRVSTSVVEIKSTFTDTSWLLAALAAAAPIPALGNPIPPSP